MNIVLYKNGSDNNVVDKVIMPVGEKEIRLKEPVIRETPTLLLSGSVDDSFDYFLIPEWNRYYFVDYKRQIAENTYMLEAKIDVLMSFKDKIREADAIIEHCETLLNNYVNDSTWVRDVRKTTHTINFPNSFNTDPQFVLITAGVNI